MSAEASPLRSWLKPIPTHRRRGQQLRCEQLEDRVVPAITLVPSSGPPAWIEQGSQPMLNSNTNAAPGNPATGAVEGIAIDPNNPARMFLATVNGGIWRTLNGNRPFNGVDDDGANGVDDAFEQPDWTPLTDGYQTLSMGDIRFDPLDPSGNTLYARTGSTSSLAEFGGPSIGVMKTTDGGNTWTTTALTAGLFQPHVRAILPTAFDADPVAPGVQQVVLVGTRARTYRSTNGGLTYTDISGINGLPAGTATQIVADPNNPAQFFAGVAGQGVYRTGDGGANWTAVNPAAAPQC